MSDPFNMICEGLGNGYTYNYFKVRGGWICGLEHRYGLTQINGLGTCFIPDPDHKKQPTHIPFRLTKSTELSININNEPEGDI